MIKIVPPVKFIWQDSYKIPVTSVAALVRHLAQPFGVNWAPIPYPQISGDIGHPGIDIALPVGERVFAAHSGKILEVDNSDDRDGLGVSIYDPIQKIITWYWHNSLNYVRIGDIIKEGQLIGLSGGTGKVYGPHLHFQLHQTDDQGKIINYNNGYHGAIDPVPYFIMPVVDTDHMTRDFVSNFYLFYFGRLPELSELDFWDGKNYKDLFTAALEGRVQNFKTNQM